MEDTALDFHLSKASFSCCQFHSLLFYVFFVKLDDFVGYLGHFTIVYHLAS